MTHPQSYRRILHKMGYYEYQRGLIYRYLDQENGWENHQQKCRDFIIRAVDIIQPEKITILGSGWLLDLPLIELAEKVKKVCLVDIVHPPEVVNQTAKLKNIELSEQDISGGLIREVWNKAGRRTFLNKLKSLDDIVVPEYIPGDDPGTVISLNILTQIESLPERFLKRKSTATDEDFLHFRKEIQNKHLAFLGKHKSVLITDITEIITENSGKESAERTVVTELPEGKLREEWIWNFDPKGTDYNQKKSVLKVAAIIL